LIVWQFAGAGLIGATTTPFAWTTPGGFDLELMFLLGVVSMICFIFITRALSMVRAAVLAPLQYTSIVGRRSSAGWCGAMRRLGQSCSATQSSSAAASTSPHATCSGAPRSSTRPSR